MAGLIDMVGSPGMNAVGVIDFNAAAEALASVTIGGQIYQEADVAVAASGIWTNGASAADSATSLLAAINGDLRNNKPKITAVLSTVGDSVIVMANAAGTAGNLAMTKVSATAMTVENMHGGAAQGRMQMVAVNYVVTAQDILADQVHIPLPFAPVTFIADVRSTAGLTKAATGLATIATAPNRILYNFAGATDPVATDVIHVVAWG
jgi:hypothetical protein